MNVTDRYVSFVRECCSEDGVSDANCTVDQFQKVNLDDVQNGYVTACRLCLDTAREHTPLTLEDLLQWQKLAITELKKFHPEIPANSDGISNRDEKKAQQFLKDLNAAIKKLSHQRNEFDDFTPNALELSETVGNFFQEFSALHPFPKGNEFVAKLIVNYIFQWFSRPIVVFKKEEAPRVSACCKSKKKACHLIGDKMQEALLKDDTLFVRNKAVGDSASYVNEKGDELVMHWHDLHRQMDKWN